MIKRLLIFTFLLFFSFNTASFSANDLATQIKVLKQLHDDGVLTEQEFSDAKAILIEKSGTKTEESTETQLVSLPKETEKEDSGVREDFKVIITNKDKLHSKKNWERSEIYFKDYKIYISSAGTIKIRRISDNKQLLTIQGDMRVKYYNKSENLFDITISRKERPTVEEDIKKNVEQITGIVKDPVGYISGIGKKLLGKKDKNKETIATKEEIKLELRIDGIKLLHWEGRWVNKYKAFFYQVLTSGYQPFHYYIVMQGRNPFAIQMKRFNRKIDLAVRKAKKKLAIEYDITEAQIDKIIEEQTGRATQEATQEAVKDAVAAEVEAAIAQSVGDAMSEGFVSAIEDATGEAIDNAIEQELAQAIDEAIAEAVSAGIEQAAVEAGFQAFFDTIAAGGTEAEAIAAADAACAAIDSGC